MRTVLIDGASTTITRHLKELLDQRGIETVMAERGWGGEGVDKHVDVAFDCIGGWLGK